MANISELRPREAVNMGAIFSTAIAEAKKERPLLVTYVHDVYEYSAYQESLTLVMSRDLRANAELSSALALHIALKHSGKNVLLFNTVASGEQLICGFVDAMRRLEIKIPWTYQRYLPNASKEAFDDATTLPEPENLFVLDCPTSTLTPELIQKQIALHNVGVVLLNSLDFAAFDDRRKRQLAETLLDLAISQKLSIIVFTHEVRALLPRTGGRGIVGLLSAFAESVWPMLHEWEMRKWVERYNFPKFHELSLHTQRGN